MMTHTLHTQKNNPDNICRQPDNFIYTLLVIKNVCPVRLCKNQPVIMDSLC